LNALLEDFVLSSTSRWLTYLTAILYTIVGILLSLFPERLAPVFAWSVTPFMTMTIGGWCLGNAWLAWFVPRRWKLGLVHPPLIYLWLFGFSELFVLYAFRERLVLSHPIAWLYLFALMVNGITALVGLFDWLRIHPAPESGGPQTEAKHFYGVIFYILFVGFLGIYGLTVQIGAPGTNGGIFPEVMSLFTLRSFGAFYLSLALAALPLLWNRNHHTFLTHSIASYGLVVFITLAAFVYIRLFDFGARPGGLAYFGAYLVVGILLLTEFRKHGTGTGS
jgi:hypothetical protein